MKRETRHEQTLRLAINGLKVTSPVKTILHAIVAEVEGAWRDSDARLKAEVKREKEAREAHASFLAGMARGFDGQGRRRLAFSIRHHLGVVGSLTFKPPRRTKTRSKR